MNILMALSQLEVTGAEAYATTVGNELSQRGHTLHYVSDTLSKPHQGEYHKLRFNKRSIPRRFWHIGYLVYLIKKHQIQLVHAHSRASSWSCHIACKLTKTPMITTVHGRQPVHASRKKFHAMGDLALPVCEAIEQQLHEELVVPFGNMVVSRNGIATDQFKATSAPQNAKPIITIIGRLTGPKGELCYQLLKNCIDTQKYQVQVLSGSTLAPRFMPFQNNVNFLGYSDNVQEIMASSDLVIGAGRVAMESVLCGRPTLAIGEASCIGILDAHNIQQAMACNFGDIGPKDLDINFDEIASLIELGLSQKHCCPSVIETVEQNYNLHRIVDQLEAIYQSVYVSRKKVEMPIIMYHRFIKHDDEKGIHGTYMHVQQLEKHFKLIKKLGYTTLFFSDIAEKGFIHRLSPGKRYMMVTVDDGYEDNLHLLLPLLEKYEIKATIYIVTGETFNRWDVENDTRPEKKVSLMTKAQVKQIEASPFVEIGGHTLTHPDLRECSREDVENEIFENKKQLELLLGKPLLSFAYPYGYINQQAKEVAQAAGYKFAVATDSGPLVCHQDLFQIRRIAIFPRTDTFGLWRKIRGNYTFRKYKK